MGYSAYVKEQATIDAIFDKFDDDKSGLLESTELLPMMRMLAPDVDVDEEDVHFVMRQCDDDDNGAISRDELLPLLAAWKQMVQQKPAAQKVPAAASIDEATPRPEAEPPADATCAQSE